MDEQKLVNQVAILPTILKMALELEQAPDLTKQEENDPDSATTFQ